MQSEIRHIANKIQPAFDSQALRDQLIQLLRRDFATFKDNVDFREPIAICSKKGKSSSRTDLYEGIGGYLYCLTRLLKSPSANFLQDLKFDKKGIANACQDILVKIDAHRGDLAKQLSVQDRITFITGDSGALSVGMHAASLLGMDELKARYFSKLLSLTNYVLTQPASYYGEILYGLPGLLYSLLYVKKNLPGQPLEGLDDSIFAMYLAIVEMGALNYQKLLKANPKEPFRLVYAFHQREYLGGAHGLLGVIHILLQALDFIIPKLSKEQATTVDHIFQSLDFCIGLQAPSGNFPSGTKSEKYSLVQFCHGSPGAIPPLLKAVDVLSKLSPDFQKRYEIKAYLSSAFKAAENVWEYGILLKGFNICHGITGNAYALLEFSKYHFIEKSKKEEWTRKAMQLILLKNDPVVAKAVSSYDFPERHVRGMSDYPYSLMLGLAGDLCLEMDLLDGACTYPGYDV